MSFHCRSPSSPTARRSSSSSSGDHFFGFFLSFFFLHSHPLPTPTFRCGRKPRPPAPPGCDAPSFPAERWTLAVKAAPTARSVPTARAEKAEKAAGAVRGAPQRASACSAEAAWSAQGPDSSTATAAASFRRGRCGANPRGDSQERASMARSQR